MPRDVIAEESQLVRDLLSMEQRMSDPQRWCKGQMYLKRDGVATEVPERAYAACFSGHAALSVGASVRRLDPSQTNRITDIFKAFCAANPVECRLVVSGQNSATPIPFNDSASTTHDMMMAAMRRAIEYARRTASRYVTSPPT